MLSFSFYLLNTGKQRLNRVYRQNNNLNHGDNTMAYPYVYPRALIPAQGLRAGLEGRSLLSDMLGITGLRQNQETPAQQADKAHLSQSRPHLKTSRPKVDLIESEHQYLIRLELAGIDPDTVSITLDKSILSVSVRRDETKLDKGQRLVQSEIRAYAYCRHFDLPEDAETADIKASSQNGILRLQISRKIPNPPKKIKVTQH
jgi:HSP20 family molecular chaperone IbpA